QAATFGIDAFATISDAVDAVQAGGTVHILAGEYNESIVVNKAGVRLLGAGRDVTFVRGNGQPAITINASGVTVQGLDLTSSDGALDPAIPGDVTAIQLAANLSGVEIVDNRIHDA